MAKQIFVTGHKSPDTDSICSSIAYAKLKQLQGIDATPIRAGEPNKETAFALDYFHVAPQPLVKDFYVKVSEAVHTEVEALPVSASLKDAAKWFASHESDVAPVADNGQFVGVIEKSQLADEFIKTVMGEELSTVKGLAHDPELFFKPTDNGHDIPADGKYAVVENGKYVGMICADCVAAAEKQPVILVDHNETAQGIPGLEEIPVIEVVDHHRISFTSTPEPIKYTADAVGSTCTLVARMFRGAGLRPSKEVAGVLLAGIVADTLLFQSPTTVGEDHTCAAWLEKICGMSAQSLMDGMMSVASALHSMTPEKAVDSDRKTYSESGWSFSLAQLEESNLAFFHNQRDALDAELARVLGQERLDFVALLVTDPVRGNSELLFRGAEVVRRALPWRTDADGIFLLPGVLSRKKQLLPAILSTLATL